MLRELQTILNKNVDAQYKADADMVTGMGVVKNFADKTADLPSVETAEGIFFVNKERIPTGINTARAEMSDYDDDFVKIVEGEFVKLITPLAGEVYGTDQYVSTDLQVGDVMSVETNGKWKKAGAGVTSRFVYTGTHNDNGKVLARIEVTAKAKTNS